MSKRQKQIAIIGGAAVALILVYKWWQNRHASNAANAGAATTSTDPNSSDYAALAGQEQGDTAALQQQYQQLMSQEQSDVAALQAQQQSAAADASRQIGDFMNFPPGSLAQLRGQLETTPAPSVPSVATGTTPVNRTAAKPFKPIPPKYAPIGSVWRGPSSPGAGWRGIGAGWWAPPLPHPSAPKQTHIGHPNSDHTSKTQVSHPNQPKSGPKPPPPPPKPYTPPTPKPPPKASKPKKSGVHR
jgi:uncharacterized protein with PIN domain